MPTQLELSQQLLDDIYRLYTDSEVIVLNKLTSRVKKSVDGRYVNKADEIRELKEEVEKIIDLTNSKAQKTYVPALGNMYTNSRKSVSRDLQVVLDSLKDVVPTQITRLILEMNGTIENSKFRILRQVDDAYRSIIAETTTGFLVGVESKKEVAQKTLNKFADMGITGFIDKVGRRWDLGSYTSMAIRATASRAALQGHIDRQQELGEDLMIVSSFGNTCPLCAPWEGRVISISGQHPKYPSLSLAQDQGLFHPNCKHTLLTYFEGITEDVKQDYEPEVYEAQQKQRYIERQIRHWKKRQAVSLDDVGKTKAVRKVREWQSVQRDHVSQYNLRRKYVREGNVQT